MNNLIVYKSILALALSLSVLGTSCQTRRTQTSTKEIGSHTHTLIGDFKLLEVDNLGNVFLVKDDNEILKLRDNEILFRYSSKRLGEISRLDVTNPQKVLVYYGDYYQIVFLDNTLSEIDKLDLEEFGFWDIQSVSLTRDNYVWLYDPVNVKLVKIDGSGNTILSSNELYDLGFNSDYSPSIQVADDMVWLYDNNEIKIFDEYGTWTKTIPLANSGIQFHQKGVIYIQDNNLMLYPTDVQLKDNDVQLIALGKTRDFHFSQNEVHVIDMKGYLKKNIK